MPPGTEITRLERPPERLWDRIRAQPQRAPELIALEAAERFGPDAARWAARYERTHTPDRAATVALRRHVRLARLEGAVLGVGGVYTAGPDLVALVWIQSRMVYYIAAAYRFDPTHPMRPAELLTLQGVYKTPAEARRSLDGIGPPMAHALVRNKLGRGGNRQLVATLLKYATRRVAERSTSKLIPLVSSPIAAVQNGGATKYLGRRAITYYGG